MPITESSAGRLMLQAGRACLLLDRRTGQATLQRKVLFWKLKPAKARLPDISDLTVDDVADRASGARAYYITLDLRNGSGWLFRAADRSDAESIVAAVRKFLGRTLVSS